MPKRLSSLLNHSISQKAMLLQYVCIQQQNILYSFIMSTIKCHKGLQFQLLYDEAQIKAIIQKVAAEINVYYQSILEKEGTLDLVVLCVLKGSFMFYSDIVKLIQFEHRNEFVKLKSYSGLNSTGEIRVETEMKPQDYAGKSILIVEDMHDTGTTLKQFVKILQSMSPKRVDTAVLVRRPDRPVQVDLKFCGLLCSDFIVGYGLDFDQFGRHFPAIYQKI